MADCCHKKEKDSQIAPSVRITANTVEFQIYRVFFRFFCSLCWLFLRTESKWRGFEADIIQFSCLHGLLEMHVVVTVVKHEVRIRNYLKSFVDILPCAFLTSLSFCKLEPKGLSFLKEADCTVKLVCFHTHRGDIVSLLDSLKLFHFL